MSYTSHMFIVSSLIYGKIVLSLKITGQYNGQHQQLKRALKAFICNNYYYTPTEILRKSLLIFNIINL